MKRKMTKLLSAILCLCMAFSLIPAFSLTAMAAEGIYNNGLHGIYIDIYSDPFVAYAQKSYGEYAYGPEGCAWFASARACQITGRDTPIWSGESWWQNRGGDSYTRDNDIRAYSLVCYTGHILVVERVDGDTVTVSEGGYSTYPNNGYCVIRDTTKAELKQYADYRGSFLGCVHIKESSSDTPASSDPSGCIEIADGTYSLSTKLDKNLFLDVAGGEENINANLQIYGGNGSKAQRFQFTKHEIDGIPYYKITTECSNWKMALDVPWGDATSGKQIWQYDKGTDGNDNPSQLWLIYDTGDGYYAIRPKLNTALSLDVRDGKKDEGTVVQIHTNNTTDAQRWRLIPQFTPVTISEGIYTLTPQNATGLRLDVFDRNGNDNADIQINRRSGNTSQQFQLISAGDGEYKIKSVLTGKNLDVMDGNGKSTANVRQFDPNETPSQRWNLERTPDGYYYIRSCLNTVLCLDVDGGQSGDGTNVQLYTNNASPAQKWKLEAVEAEKPGTTTTTAAIALSKSSLTLSVGESETLTVNVTPSGTSVTWSSSDTSVATVDGGRVTGVKAGAATITASAGDKTAACTVTVVEKQQSTPNTPAQTGNGIGVTVRGTLVLWTDVEPFIDENSRTMVPLRAVGDALGLTVGWNDVAREASFTDGIATIYFQIGSRVARTDMRGVVEMDTAAVIVNDRTYAPVRYLAEYFGYTVNWDAVNRTVVIT